MVRASTTSLTNSCNEVSRAYLSIPCNCSTLVGMIGLFLINASEPAFVSFQSDCTLYSPLGCSANVLTSLIALTKLTLFEVVKFANAPVSFLVA